jgi:hypothetical protein
MAMKGSSCQRSASSQSFSVVPGMLQQIPGALSVVAINAVVLAGAGTGENQVKVWFEACQNNGHL